MQSITPFLTFDGRAEEAIRFYCSLFKDSKIISMDRWDVAGPAAKGSVVGARFRLAGQEFMAMDVPGGFPKGEGVSIYVNCDTQEQVDLLYEKLSVGGEKQPCGWLKDKYGFSWQIIPSALPDLLSKSQGARKQAVIDAMLKMGKIEIKGLQEAYEKA